VSLVLDKMRERFPGLIRSRKWRTVASVRGFLVLISYGPGPPAARNVRLRHGHCTGGLTHSRQAFISAPGSQHVDPSAHPP
jgi:hypothetical protein